MNPVDLAASFHRTLAGVGAMPSVVSASLADQVPLTGNFSYTEGDQALWPRTQARYRD